MNKANKKSEFNKLLLLITLMLISIIYLLYPSIKAYIDNYFNLNPINAITCDDIYDNEPSVLCKKGEIKEYKIKNSKQVAKFICLGEMNIISGYNRSFKLNNGKVLIYNQDFAELYDPKTKKFTIVDGLLAGLSSHDYRALSSLGYLADEFEYIKISNDKYLLLIGSIYNEKTNRLEVFTSKQLENYTEFIKSRKDSIKEIQFIKTLNNKFLLYTGLEYNKSVIWVEDPINLKRSKYGQFNNKASYINAEMINEDNILIVEAETIDLFNLKTGKISILINDINTGINSFQPNMIKLNNDKFLLSDYLNNRSYTFDFITKTIQRVNNDTQNKTSSSILNLAKDLSQKNKNIKEINDGRNYTVISNNEVLITGGLKSIRILCPFIFYKSAELMSIEDKP